MDEIHFLHCGKIQTPQKIKVLLNWKMHALIFLVLQADGIILIHLRSKKFSTRWSYMCFTLWHYSKKWKIKAELALFHKLHVFFCFELPISTCCCSKIDITSIQFLHVVVFLITLVTRARIRFNRGWQDLASAWQRWISRRFLSINVNQWMLQWTYFTKHCWIPVVHMKG